MLYRLLFIFAYKLPFVNYHEDDDDNDDDVYFASAAVAY